MKKIKDIKIQQVELSPRKKPAQRRAEETVALILETSAQVLVKVGLDDFNTNMLAEHAGLRVSTVYRYFPNKLAILTALVQNLRDTIIEALTSVEVDDDDWQSVIYAYIDAYVVVNRENSAFFAIRRAIQSSPKLYEIEKELELKLSSNMARLLLEKGVEIRSEDLTRVIQVFLVAGAAICDLAYLKGKKDKESEEAIIRELKVMSINYLANYCS
ncbi:TetR/AcrR family transcriptional regulator [Desulforhopalus singaporensis]|uniref:Transcriptional regulator, TetR family n=1 Tax=Desulforhopalus singaporensis TaxID=91360 RepID=A0A1H0UEW4_9BACT|nr:TetR/AcrR family transcriptional regulator [Desulforhopalus singaporensis]SDP64709.1 transcriptional regulator, TetR family [Desulforhopalus singaporensis]